MGINSDAAAEIEKVFRKYHFTYDQTKRPVEMARRRLHLKPTGRRKGTVERLSSEEGERFIDTAYRQNGVRGLMLTTLLETGARVSEFCDIAVADVSFDERLITIRNGKGGKRREIPIRQELARMLQVHIAGRMVGFLFESRLNGKFSARRIEQIVKETAVAAGIQKNIHPHTLRHSIATRLVNSGMPINQIQVFLGHESIQTTEIYAKTETSTVRAGFDEAMKS